MKSGSGQQGSPSRAYRMSSRAESAERTAERILDSTVELFGSLPYDRIRLDEVAERAGVTVQTVIRRFDNKAGLMNAMVRRELSRIAAARASLPPGNPQETIRSLVAHYEHYGRLIIKFYAEADLVPGLPELAIEVRAFHVGWCRGAFETEFDSRWDADTTQRRLVQIIAICDVATWRLLRVEGQLSLEQTELGLSELLLPLLQHH